MMRAAILCALLALPGAAGAACPGPDGVTGSAMTGTWRVGVGAANVNALPMIGGTDELVLQGSGDGVTLLLDGRRIALERTSGLFDWQESTPEELEAGIGAAVSAQQVAVVLGCNVADMSKWQGSSTVDGEVVVWRIMAVSGREAVLHWSLSGPVQAQGLFQITK